MRFNIIVNPTTIGKPSFWDTYKPKNKRQAVKSKKELNKLITALFKNANKAMHENNGVVLEGLGYAGIWMPLVRRFKEQKMSGRILQVNHKTNYYNFTPTLFTDVFRTDFFKGWSMDFAFNRGVSRTVLKEVKEGRSYPLYYTEIKQIYK